MHTVIHIGASGAVGGEVLKKLSKQKEVSKYTLIGRRILSGIPDTIEQREISIFDANSYKNHIKGHTIAICTLGVGQPSKISKEEFVKIDKLAVLDFAKACKENGVQHFQLLASIGINANSSSFYLKTKGELVNELIDLNFERLSVFMPSMIITPKNRYGFLQAVTLKFWPILDKLFVGGAKKYKGINVSVLGESIANNCFTAKSGLEYLVWEDFKKLKKIR